MRERQGDSMKGTAQRETPHVGIFRLAQTSNGEARLLAAGKEIAKQFIALESTDPNEMNTVFEQCKSVLDLRDGVKPFDVFATLDEKVRENSGPSKNRIIYSPRNGNLLSPTTQAANRSVSL
jgi:hypothetical protein